MIKRKERGEKISAREKHKSKMLKYWGDPKNEFITRQKMHNDVLKISAQTLYMHFTPNDITEIESEAFELRKKHSVRDRHIVYKAMLKAAKNGNIKAIKEYLDRTEGKVTDKHEVTGKEGKDLVPILNVTTTKN